MTWQPIETAPKDQLIMLWRPEFHGCDIGRSDKDQYAKKPSPYWRSYFLYGLCKA
jgi:hypothetical protein